MMFAILATAAAATLMSLALLGLRPEPRRVPVRERDRAPRQRPPHH